MKTTTKISGFKELESKLRRFERTFTERKNNQTMRDGAEILLNEMQLLVPVDRGGLRDSLVIVDDGLTVKVGPSSANGLDGWRAHFVEFGTVKMSAQPFIRPSFDNTEGQVKTTIASTINAEIDKAKK